MLSDFVGYIDIYIIYIYNIIYHIYIIYFISYMECRMECRCHHRVKGPELFQGESVGFLQCLEPQGPNMWLETSTSMPNSYSNCMPPYAFPLVQFFEGLVACTVVSVLLNLGAASRCDLCRLSKTMDLDNVLNFIAWNADVHPSFLPSYDACYHIIHLTNVRKFCWSLAS